MAVKYSINATIFDITKDTPSQQDSFLVDSNVWYWLAYPYASSTYTPAHDRQLTTYPDYIKKTRKHKSKLFHCSISFIEIANLIEGMLYEIYKSTYDVNLKECRHNDTVERARVVKEITSAWGSVKSMSENIDLVVDDSITQNIINNLGAFPVDSYDYLLLEFLRGNGMDQIITDDGDFSTVPGLKVFTSNPNVIRTAQKQGKLKTRNS